MGLYLREIRYLMRKFEGRVTWEWMKSHTDGKGWIYERHNKCDRVAGEVVLDDNLDQQRFVQWNRDYILVGRGKRIEGDPRQKVRNRIAELFWTSRPSSKGRARWDAMSVQQQSMLKKVFKNKGDGHAKKEILAAVEERMGLKCEYAKDDAVCRVCTQECECERKRKSPKQKGREGGKDCTKCRETLNHVMMAQCNQTTRILKEELIESLRNWYRRY